MKFLRSNIDEKPIVAAFLVAIIVGLICLIIYVNKYYVPQFELPPKLVAKTSDGQEVELLLMSYDWTYKGEEKTYSNLEDLSMYEFNGENTLYSKLEFGIDYAQIQTEPKYKVKGFSSSTLRYNTVFEEYEPGNGSIISEEDKTVASYPIEATTTLVTITLYSETQGTATYGLKTIESYYIDIDEVKELGKLDFNKDSIESFLKEQTYGRFLNNTEIENNKLTITYDYYIDKSARMMYTNILFALIQDLDEIEFKFLQDKYVQSSTDPDTYITTYTESDNLEPIAYSRNSFIDTYLDLPLEELEAYLRK